MTSYALSMTVVVVNPRRLDLVCRKNGGKQAENPWVRNSIEKNVMKTTSLTEESVPGASFLFIYIDPKTVHYDT